jgi:hypothetical protein
LFSRGWRRCCNRNFNRLRWRRRFHWLWLVNFRLGLDYRCFRSWQGCPLDHLDGALDGGFLLRKVLVADLLGQLLRDGVGGHTHVDTFTTHLFDKSLGVELQFFGEIVNANFRGNCHALLLDAYSRVLTT